MTESLPTPAVFLSIALNWRAATMPSTLFAALALVKATLTREGQLGRPDHETRDSASAQRTIGRRSLKTIRAILEVAESSGSGGVAEETCGRQQDQDGGTQGCSLRQLTEDRVADVVCDRKSEPEREIALRGEADWDRPGLGPRAMALRTAMRNCSRAEAHVSGVMNISSVRCTFS